MTWRQFVFPVVAANLGIAFAYAACGAGSENQKTLMIATVASGTVPLLIALVIRNRLPTVATDSVKRPQR